MGYLLAANGLTRNITFLSNTRSRNSRLTASCACQVEFTSQRNCACGSYHTSDDKVLTVHLFTRCVSHFLASSYPPIPPILSLPAFGLKTAAKVVILLPRSRIWNSNSWRAPWLSNLSISADSIAGRYKFAGRDAGAYLCARQCSGVIYFDE